MTLENYINTNRIDEFKRDCMTLFNQVISMDENKVQMFYSKRRYELSKEYDLISHSFDSLYRNIIKEIQNPKAWDLRHDNSAKHYTKL